MLTLKDLLAIAAQAQATPDAHLLVKIKSESNTIDLYLDLSNFTVCVEDRYLPDPKVAPIINGLIVLTNDNTKAIGEPAP